MRYWLPDYEKKLIGELQKQQNSAQFCDTLLQTEGISIPTHSSVLGALSLHLSQRLLATPAPPAGQKRRVQLHALKPQTLIKLIGLMYSGELEVSSALEQRDVLAAVNLFGLPDLVEVENNQNGCKDCGRVETEKRDAQIQVTPRNFRVSIGTQTIIEESMQTTEHSQHQQSTATSNNSTSTTRTGNLKASREGESILKRPTRAKVSLSCPSENMALHVSPGADSVYLRLQEGEALRVQPVTSAEGVRDSPAVEEEQRKVSENKEKNTRENRRGSAVVEKRQVCKKVATKSLKKMQEMIEATQISIKVKLRRRTNEELWEVVNMQEPDALRWDNCKRPQPDITAAVQLPDNPSVPEPLSSSPKPGPHTSDALCESVSAPSGDPVPLQPPRTMEETDEQIEKLLEDIMIGLNILPKMDKGNDESRHQDLSREASSQVEKDKASYCVCYKDYRDNSGNCSTETDDSDCTVPPPAEPCGANSNLNPNNSSFSAGRRDGPQNSPHPTTSSCFTTDQESNPQENPNVLELLPPSTETEDSLISIADLHFLPCLSPLESNNNSTCGNDSPAHSSLPGRTWLMDKPRSLQFPLAAVAQKLQNSPVKPSTSSGCKEEVSNNNESNSPLANRQKVLRKVSGHLDSDVAPQSAKKRCPALGLNKTCKDLKVKMDANINLSPCLVSLSCNNVLAKDGSLATPPPSAPQTPIRRRLRPKTQRIGDLLRQMPIKTRRKSQRSHSTPETSSSNLQASKNERKRGRPRKMPSKKQKNEQLIENPSLEKSDEAPSEAKRPSLGEDIEEGPSKQIVPINNSIHGKSDDNNSNNTTPAEKKPRMVNLKEFQELIKRQHLKTQRIKNVLSDSIQKMDSANSQSDDADVTEDNDEQSQSSTQLLSQSEKAKETPPRVENSVSSVNWLNSLSENGHQSEISLDVIPEEVTKLSEEMEEGQRTSPELFDDGATDGASEDEVAVFDSLPLAATQEEKNTLSNHMPNVCESKKSNGLDLKEASTSSPGGLQDDEEDVDILLHSPDRTSETTEGQKSVEISPDEEDTYEVDVTGSETDT